MKRKGIAVLLVLALALLLVPATGGLAADVSQLGWVRQQSGTTEDMTHVDALDANTAWAVGWGGTVLKCVDGVTWNPMASGVPTNIDLQGISALDDQNAWLVGHSGTVRLTTDGGTNWNPPADTSPFGSTNFKGVQMLDSQTVWIVGYVGTILKTIDGGGSWITQTSGTTKDLFDISAVDTNTAWAVGQDGVLLHTTDSGTTWNQQNIPTNQKLRGVVALDSNTAWAAGFSGVIIKTVDGGASWDLQTTPVDDILFDITAVDATTAWAVGYDDFDLDSGIILHTMDGGTNWYQQNGTITRNLLGVSAVSDRVAWAVGNEGHIYKTTNGGESMRRWYLAEGSTNGGFETWVLVQNPGNTPADVNITYMTPTGEVAGPSETVPAESRRTYNVSDHVPNEWSVSTFVDAAAPVIAERAMYWNNRVGGHDSIGVTYPATTWYLAEGSTDGGFETWVLVQNPGDTAANVQLFYQTPTGETPGQTFQLDPMSRDTMNVADVVPNEWSVSTRVESDEPVIAERAMYWSNYGNYRIGGHDSVGVTGAAETWYLAEGSTDGGFETWVLVQNPGDTAANVQLFYQTPTGETPGQTFQLGPRSRDTVFVADVVPREWSVSTRVESDQPVIAERAMYWNNRTGGHDSIGVTNPQDTWFLAEGSTNGGFETWILVQNPGDTAANVELYYQTPTGETPGQAFELGPRSRRTMFVADVVPNEWSVSTRVESDVPVIAERAMYWNNRIGGHDSIGYGLL